MAEYISVGRIVVGPPDKDNPRTVIEPGQKFDPVALGVSDAELQAMLVADPEVIRVIPTEEQGSAPTNVDIPMVSGDAAIGATLNCTMGNWNGEPTGYEYAWKRDSATGIEGSGNSYVTVAADAGHAISCVVTATNAAGSTEAPESNAIAIPDEL